MSIKLHLGDCLDVLRGLPDNSVDSVVTDPPYGLSFMGKRWDYDVPRTELWAECLRVLKPGGHLLAFAGTRTQHRMAVRIEDAGFEIRDMIAWVYGSGFPKSLDVSKAIDKLDAAEARTERRYRFTGWFVTACSLTPRQLDEVCGTNTMGRHWTDVRPNGKQPDVPTREYFEMLRPHFACDVPAWIEQMVDERTVESENFKARQVTGTREKLESWDYKGNNVFQTGGDAGRVTIVETAAHTEAARQWEGWGTALKPALEPITVARKPRAGTVAANVLAHGTGALNIDGCRVGGPGGAKWETPRGGIWSTDRDASAKLVQNDQGRWPANLIHDGSEEVVEVFGDPARFFYCAKASKKDRGETNNHPTVKPTDLMRYLCRLVTPPGGTVLDPFMGSGSTGKAAVLERFGFAGIERDPEYFKLAEQRVDRALDDLLLEL